MPTRVVLDCDTGTDDAVAIMMAALHPDLELVAVTTVWGNQSVADTTENTLRVLDLVGRSDIPVYAGLDRPAAPRLPSVPLLPYAGSPHLPIAPAATVARAQPAVEWLVETLRGETEPLTVVPTGPLSNIAAAVSADRSIVDAVAELVVLGGAHAVANVTPAAERNFWNDPGAAATVLGAGFERVVLVTVDATYGAAFTAEQGRELAALGTPAGSAAAAFLAERIAGYSRLPSMGGRQVAPVHDALPVAYLVDRSVLELRHAFVAVETEGRVTYGRSVLDLDGLTGMPPNAHVALRADADRFFAIVKDALVRSPGT